MMLLICYLAYLYNEFLVQDLLAKDSGDANAAQLDVSAMILSTILTLGRQWERSTAVQRDFTRIVGNVQLYLRIFACVNILNLARFLFMDFLVPAC